MRIGKLLMIAFILSVLVTAGGCTQYYRFDFVSEQDLTNDEGVWREYTEGGSKDFDSERGIRLSDYVIRTPMSFKGDFTITIDFYLKLDAINYSDIGFFLCDDNYPDDFNQIFYISLNYAGTTKKNLYVSEWQEDPSLFEEEEYDQTPPSDIVSNGDNTFVLEKTGDIIYLTFNDKYIYGPYTLDHYSRNTFYPTLAAYQDMLPFEDFGVYIKNIEVKYE